MLNGVPRILIIRLSAIGDVVRVLPALHALRDLYPTAQIDWVVEPKSAAIVEGHPALDQVILFHRSEAVLDAVRAFQETARQIKQNRYDIVLDFHGILKSGLLMRASKAPKRLAFAPPRSQEMSHLFANERVALPSQRMNRIEENLALAQALGAKLHSLDVVIEVPHDAEDDVDEYLEDAFHADKKLALIHAPVERPEKQWPLGHYAQLCDMLAADGRFEVLLTWGPGQLEVAQEVMRLSKRKPLIAPETPDLKHFAALAARAGLFFGGDTGPMHIASAMGVPVAVVFGGTDPAKHAPLRKPSEVLYAGPEPFPKDVTLSEAQQYLAAVLPEAAYDACLRAVSPPRPATTA
jgi:heptosyltransferase-1